MRVAMTVQITGTRDGRDWPAPGGVIDVPEAEAADLIRAGLATAVQGRPSVPTVETATEAPAERAVAPRQRRG